jgi:hypothetical protein
MTLLSVYGIDGYETVGDCEKTAATQVMVRQALSVTAELL